MPDRAVSDHPEVQRRLDRLEALSPGTDVLGLERISALLDRLGNPERRLPPVFHVAGTNGKGSTCAFLRAAIEAAGLKAHVYTSPHLVRFNERIRLGGALIGDEALADLLGEVLDSAEGIGPSFFEATTAAAFLAFAREPADACIVEVGLGGRLDATNVIERPVACGIASLSIDHEAFLLAPEEGTPQEPMARIAFEKAGIAKPGVPLVTHYYSEPEANWAIEEVAAEIGAPLYRPVGPESWLIKRTEKGQLSYIDEQGYAGRPKRHLLPAPRLLGEHQVKNAGLAIAMLRHQSIVDVSMDAIAKGIAAASWPARLQQLASGPLRNLLSADTELWLDGAHNPSAALEVALFALKTAYGRPLHIVCGLLSNKDAAGILAPFKGLGAIVHAVPVPGHDHHPPEALAAAARSAGLIAAPAAESVEAALASIARHADPGAPPVVLVVGSLYLAGEVLKSNGQTPA